MPFRIACSDPALAFQGFASYLKGRRLPKKPRYTLAIPQHLRAVACRVQGILDKPTQGLRFLLMVIAFVGSASSVANGGGLKPEDKITGCVIFSELYQSCIIIRRDAGTKTSSASGLKGILVNDFPIYVDAESSVPYASNIGVAECVLSANPSLERQVWKCCDRVGKVGGQGWKTIARGQGCWSDNDIRMVPNILRGSGPSIEDFESGARKLIWAECVHKIRESRNISPQLPLRSFVHYSDGS
jgi:hypothetical protein